MTQSLFGCDQSLICCIGFRVSQYYLYSDECIQCENDTKSNNAYDTSEQCPKLRCTFPQPGARFSEVCTRCVHVFLSYLLMLYIGRAHETISGCTVLGEVHPVSAQNKSMISDTASLDLSCVPVYTRGMRT